MSSDRILKEAAFKREAIQYHITAISIAFGLSIVGIPLLLIVVPIATWYWNRFYANLRMRLTTRDLKVNRGILNKEEKCIPLEKITDLAVFQGPIMRHFGVHGIRVETAGQSSGAGALVTVIGIEDVDSFRDLVLTQRDRIADREDVPAVAPAVPMVRDGAVASDGVMLDTLKDIRDTLRRIEERLANQRT